ncbi:hypothetical protein [Ferrimonas lipolytica]|uniref:Amino acid transporter, AAT family n=1 Tax=Ferrimonas lipolytica TaxID=2724191 RepID=A0A6H1U9F7_9GAMM|nr:hypothetical protein [Ferrimonas lipolytica]QIZ75671.1 hypothetical protein HER31_01385 [Ferrimonas lipolytica]
MEKYGIGYLDERKLVSRAPTAISGIVSLLLVSAVFYLTWWIFQDPRGLMRMYTPYVGYMYCRWWLIMMIWMVYLFDFWPFKRQWLNNTHPVIKGFALTAISVFILLLLIKGFFEGFMGNLGLAYFNPEQLEKLPGITSFFAIEYASLAILMFAAIASWLSPAWVVACENSPWEKLPQPVRGITILLVTFFLSMVVYFVTMHSHMAILYQPWQAFTAVTPPYWENFADTVSGNFHISWIMCCTVVVWLVETIWQRYPFNLIKHDTLRRVSLFAGIILMALALHFFLYFAQDLTWGEAIRGTRREFSPDWRWLHVGEMAIFWLVPALALNFYFNNWPRKFSMPVNAMIRTLITVVAAVLLYIVYYKTSHLFLGTQKGFSHPQQFPMIPMIWLVNIMLVHHWFMDNWPMWSMQPKSVGELQAERAEQERLLRAESPDRSFGLGIGVGVAVGVMLYFAVVALLPSLYVAVDVLK